MSQPHRRSASLSLSRRSFVLAATGAAAAGPPAERAAAAAPPPGGKLPEVVGSEHWTTRVAGGAKVRLFLWRKRLRTPGAGDGRQGTVLFVHGSSISSTPTFDLQVPGRPELSAMDWFARRGY